MSLKQLTIFVENKQGTLVDITDILAKNNINMRALSIADTQDFGILRLIVNDNETATKALTDAGYLLKMTDVVGVKIGDQPGKLSKALEVLDSANINMEYLYAFMARTEKHAYVVLRVADNDAAEKALEAAGFHMITDADVDKL
ncbi:MAG: acetolactate synthase [Clostridia bacterium]|nr:acetolactate synthase [Clostridia bacterium]